MSKKSDLSKLAAQLRRRHIDRRTFMSNAVASGLSVSLATAAANTAMAATPKSGGRFTLAIGHGSTSDSLDPATYNSGFTLNMANSLGNQLTEVMPDGTLNPELAESFESNATADEWVFKLRKGVEFHNGKTMTADDVIASYVHHMGDDSKSGVKKLLTQVKNFRKDDSHTVVFELESGNADFPYVCSDYHISIFPETDGKLNWQDGNGTGAFVLDSFEPGVRAQFSKNPNYFKSNRGHFDSVEILSILDPTARQNALLTGVADTIDKVELKTASLLGAKEGVNLLEVTGTLHYVFPMRTPISPFDNNDLRLAIKHAADRKEMLQKVLHGHGALGNDHPISVANRYHNADIPQRELDLDKAKFHLKKSGLGNSTLELSAADAAFNGSIDAAVLMEETGKKIGLDIKVVREPNDGYWSNVWRQKMWFASYWGGRPTEDWMFTIGYAADAPWNESSWKHDRFNELLVAARTELDSDKRRDVYGEMQLIMHNEGATLIPLFANHVMGLRDNVDHPDTLTSTWELDGGKATERWWFSS